MSDKQARDESEAEKSVCQMMSNMSRLTSESDEDCLDFCTPSPVFVFINLSFCVLVAPRAFYLASLSFHPILGLALSF